MPRPKATTNRNQRKKWITAACKEFSTASCEPNHHWTPLYSITKDTTTQPSALIDRIIQYPPNPTTIPMIKTAIEKMTQHIQIFKRTYYIRIELVVNNPIILQSSDYDQTKTQEICDRWMMRGKRKLNELDDHFVCDYKRRKISDGNHNHDTNMGDGASDSDHAAMPPPPALEPIEMPNGCANGLNTNTNTHETNHVNNEDLVVTVVKHPVTGSMVDITEVESDHKTNANQEKQEETSMNHVETQGKVEEDDGGECLNDGNTDDGEEADFLPDLTVPLDSPSPTSKHSAKQEDVDRGDGASDSDHAAEMGDGARNMSDCDHTAENMGDGASDDEDNVVTSNRISPNYTAIYGTLSELLPVSFSSDICGVISHFACGYVCSICEDTDVAWQGLICEPCGKHWKQCFCDKYYRVGADRDCLNAMCHESMEFCGAECELIPTCTACGKCGCDYCFTTCDCGMSFCNQCVDMCLTIELKCSCEL